MLVDRAPSILILVTFYDKEPYKTPDSHAQVYIILFVYLIFIKNLLYVGETTHFLFLTIVDRIRWQRIVKGNNVNLNSI